MNLLIRIAGCAALLALFLPGVHIPDLIWYLVISLLFICSVPLLNRLKNQINRTDGILQAGLRALTFGVWTGAVLLLHRACLLYPLWALLLFVLCLSLIWVGGSTRQIRIQIAVAASTGFCLLELVHGPAFIACWTVLAVLTSWPDARCSQVADFMDGKFGKWWLASALGLVFVLYFCHMVWRDAFRISYSFEAGVARNAAVLVCCSLPLLVSIAALRFRSKNVWRTQTLLGLLLILFVSVEGIVRSFGSLGYGKISHAVTRDEFDILYSDDNLLGMRGEEFTVHKRTDSFRILILGDSITYGAGVKSEEAFPQLLKNDLLPNLTGSQLEVLNVSRAGWNSENELAALHNYLPYQPDMIVLGVCMNDVENSQDRFQPAPTFLSTICDRYFSWSYTFSLLAYLSERRSEAQDKTGYDYYLNAHFKTDSEGWLRFEKDIAAMCELAEASAIPFVAVLFPIFAERTPALEKLHDQMSKCLVRSNVKLVDLRDVYRHHHWRDLSVSFADGHPNAVAHRLAAEAVQKKIAELLVK